MALWEDLGLYSTKVTRKQSTSFKTRFLAKSPGANGLKAFCCDCLITDKILKCECECGTASFDHPGFDEIIMDASGGSKSGCSTAETMTSKVLGK